MPMTVLICGRPADGFQIVALFADRGDAESYAENHSLKDWWIGRTIFDPVQQSKFGIAAPSCACQNGLEDWLQLAGRTGDHLQHLGGRGLLLQRFAQIVGALTQLVEEAGILDGDDRLIGKGSHQLDLFRSKWLRHGFRYEDHPYDMSFAQKRDAERGSVAAKLLSLTPGILRVRQHVGNLNHFGL